MVAGENLHRLAAGRPVVTGQQVVCPAATLEDEAVARGALACRERLIGDILGRLGGRARRALGSAACS